MRVPHLLRRPEAALFALVLAAYAYFYQAGGWNQNVRFDLIRGLVEKRSTVIDAYAHNTGDLACRGPRGRCRVARAHLDEHYYCDKAPGTSLLGAPPYVLFHVAGGSEHPSERFLTWASYVSTVWAIAVPSALGVVMLYVLLVALGLGRWPATALTLGYALATLAFPYSTIMYGHQLAAALLVAAFALLVRERHTGKPAQLGLVGALLGFSVVSEYPAALAVLPITIYAAVYIRPYRRLGWLIAGGAACALLLAVYHWVAFGGPFTLPYEFSNQRFRSLGFFMGLGAPNWEAFSNTLWTPYRGLFFSAPWLLLGIPGAVLLMRRRRFRAEALVCLAVFGLFLWMTSSLIESWHGGWALSTRYMVPAIPFLVIPTAGLVWALSPGPLWLRRAAWTAGIALAGYSALLMLAGTAVRPEVPQHIKKPFAQYILPNFYAGKLSLNPQAITMKGIPRGNPPPKAFNLGQLLGLRGLPSLLPLLVIMAGAVLWLVRAQRANRDPDTDQPAEPSQHAVETSGSGR